MQVMYLSRFSYIGFTFEVVYGIENLIHQILSIIFQFKALISQMLVIQVFAYPLMRVNNEVFEVTPFPPKMAFPTTIWGIF